ncbi:caspase family protein [Paenibacillus sp. N1-5-1-14]|uniref:caspase family protein n=1 Tax=Paenibacillus radicibacter TaxID=2972488 RepID=UPI00215992BE|nr:caspase family protein [Paenibacillus radicibacter]MCR8645665.1 caspase family protein [Paenibacillus radicibacter]
MNKKQRKILNERLGKKVMLSIGVNNYDNECFRNLNKACKDALGVFEVFSKVKNLNLNIEKSKLIVSNGTLNEGTKKNILQEIEAVTKRVSANEDLVIYFSGHGYESDGKNFIVPSDSINNEENELIEIKKIVEIIEMCECKHKLIIIDACFSGVVNSGVKGIESYNFKNLKDYLKESRSTILLSSSGRNEASYEESPSSEYSLFTTFLIEALEGKSESLKNGYLTVQSMYNYIFDNVRTICREYQGIEQRPNIAEKSNGEVILGIYDKLTLEGENDFDNNTIIQIREDEDIFNSVFKDLKIRISDSLWHDTKRTLTELIMNGFEYEKSTDIQLEISSSEITLYINGNEFHSLERAKTTAERGLGFVNNYLMNYLNQVSAAYKYENGKNIITLIFEEEPAFFIKDICVIKLNEVGFRRYTAEDIILPSGVCKKYYYYTPKRNIAMSQVRSAVTIILDKIPKDSVLVIYDTNIIKGTISFQDYILNERILYR